MPFEIEWVIPQRIFALYFSGKITIEDYQQATPIAVQHTEAGSPPVHTISDARDVTAFPTKLQDVISMMRSMGELSAKVGWIVQVTPNAMQRFTGSLLAQWFVKSARYHAVSTIHEALLFLKERDPRLSSMDIDAVEARYETWRKSTAEQLLS